MYLLFHQICVMIISSVLYNSRTFNRLEQSSNRLFTNWFLFPMPILVTVVNIILQNEFNTVAIFIMTGKLRRKRVMIFTMEKIRDEKDTQSKVIQDLKAKLNLGG